MRNRARIAREQRPSMQRSARAQRRERARNAAPAQSAACTEPKAEASRGLIRLLTTEPSRATERERPRERASSLSWNQLVMKALCATDSDSPPSPKIARPTSIPLREPEAQAAATAAWPARQKEVKRQSEVAKPHRSTMTPPMRGSTMLGSE